MCWIGAGAIEPRTLSGVRSHLERVFGLRVRLWHPPDRPQGTLDPRRGQHSSTRILEWLASHREREATKLLALTDADLFIPVLTFVYGEAQLGGVAAVVSTARLQEAEERASAQTLARRLVKEATHELGHTFGLLHCGHAGCVMSRSANIFEVDAKGAALCGDCRILLLESPAENAG